GGMALLAQPRSAGLQQRGIVGAVRRVAVGTVFLHRLVAPQERPAPLGMAGITGFVDRVFCHEHGAYGAMWVVAVGARHFAGREWMCRDLVDLGPLGLVTPETGFLLSQAIHYAVLGRVDQVT